MLSHQRIRVSINWNWPFQACLVSVFTFLIYSLGWVDISLAAGNQKETTGGGQLSILRLLDVSKVGFFVRTQPRYRQLLTDRALARLKASGLEPNKESYKGPVQATLILTLDPIPLSEVCPGKVLYEHKLELLEDITVRRDPELHLLKRPTWDFGPARPDVVNAMTTEILLADVDRYINQFIVSYGLPLPQ